MSKPSAILGISAFYHDSAAALVVDGEIVAAAQEERFTRKKHDPAFPNNAISFVLEEAGLTVADLDAVAFYDKPFIKFERLLETYHFFAPAGLRSFLSSIPVWIKEKLFLKRLIIDELKKLGSNQVPKIYFPEHHLSHAASAFYPSPFENAAILTLDGVGEWATTTICHGKNNDVSILKELDFPHSLGLLYSAFTYYCGFKVNSGEYKLMGLAPYGNPEAEETKQFRQKILDNLVDLREDGSFLLNMNYFNYATGLTMTVDKKWKALFGLSRRKSESELDQSTMNLALAIQQVTEEIVFKLAATAKEVTGAENLVMAGGVALNCVANGKLLRSKIFNDVWIQPAAGDAGGALGAALAVWHISKNKKRTVHPSSDAMRGSLLGPQFSDVQIEKILKRQGSSYTYLENYDDVCKETAAYLDQGLVVGWFQGPMEFGPRALCNRSILGDARKPDMQKKLNLKIKYREGFRPFAPVIIEEAIPSYFDLDRPSPYMLLVAPVKKDHRTKEPENMDKKDMYDRLYHLRSDVPAITHVDYSARIQSVNQQSNLKMWTLLKRFEDKTKTPMLVNTSFNVRGEPIVCSPEDAYRCFMRTEMDILVLGNYILKKELQPTWEEKAVWQEEFQLD